MGESGPDESDYSYDMDDEGLEEDWEGHMDQYDNLYNNSSDSYSEDESSDNVDESDDESEMAEVVSDVRSRRTHPGPPQTVQPPTASRLQYAPGMLSPRYSTDSGSAQSVHSTRALLKDSAKPNYAPERWPAYVDFLFVFSSFIAAVVAAYYTLA